MKNKHSSLLANFSINYEAESQTEDTRFLPITIDVLHTGENFNGSVFSKEVVDKCIDSIKNTAVLGFIEKDNITNENDFKGHEYIITKDENGVRRKYIGSAYGLIPESCNPRWIEKDCSDGNTYEYLQVDALLWTKFEDSVGIMERDSEKAQSMELEIGSVEGYEDEETGLFHFTSFRFDGCCLISKEPAMIDSVAYINNEVQFSMNDFVRSIQTELNDKFNSFTKLVNEQKNQGGTQTMPKADFAQTVMELFSDISTIVSKFESVSDKWGDEYPRYYLKDIQENEVIVVDRSNDYQVYGFPYVMNGDKAEIDFACGGKRKKTTYTDYEDGSVVPEGAFDFGKHIEEIESKAFSKVEIANQEITTAKEAQEVAETNYTQLKTNYDEIKPKYDEYVQEEQVRQENELNSQKDAEFARFEEALGENADFIALKENKADMSVEDITAKCSILFTRLTLENKVNFSKSNGSAMVAGVMDNVDDGNDGYVATKYGNIPVGR